MIGETISCESCGEPIDSATERFARRQLVWVEARSAGGTNAVRAAVELDQYAHRSCVSEIAAGHRPQPEAPVQWRQSQLF